MDVRAQRIVKSAIELAERDGYHAVRLRDVAQQAEVALATVYRRFQSQEDILIAALEHESENLQVRLRRRGMPGADPVTRVVEFFRFVTHGLIRRPNLSRALIRALATTDSDVAGRVEQFHRLFIRLTAAAWRGELDNPDTPVDVLEARPEWLPASILQQVWFSWLVGWAGGMHEESTVNEHIRRAAALLLRALETPEKTP
jgi:AcrR family transcriptional regulator